eukprot:12420025-Karenia_brevis.AAC.1
MEASSSSNIQQGGRPPWPSYIPLVDYVGPNGERWHPPGQLPIRGTRAKAAAPGALAGFMLVPNAPPPKIREKIRPTLCPREITCKRIQALLSKTHVKPTVAVEAIWREQQAQAIAAGAPKAMGVPQAPADAPSPVFVAEARGGAYVAAANLLARIGSKERPGPYTRGPTASASAGPAAGPDGPSAPSEPSAGSSDGEAPGAQVVKPSFNNNWRLYPKDFEEILEEDSDDAAEWAL